MPIPESQLETWSHQGATVTSAATHRSIRAALDAHDWPDAMRLNPYLQGSYANATNIRGNSDVDLTTIPPSLPQSEPSPRTEMVITPRKRPSRRGLVWPWQLPSRGGAWTSHGWARRIFPTTSSRWSRHSTSWHMNEIGRDLRMPRNASARGRCRSWIFNPKQQCGPKWALRCLPMVRDARGEGPKKAVRARRWRLVTTDVDT